MMPIYICTSFSPFSTQAQRGLRKVTKSSLSSSPLDLHVDILSPLPNLDNPKLSLSGMSLYLSFKQMSALTPASRLTESMNQTGVSALTVRFPSLNSLNPSL